MDTLNRRNAVKLAASLTIGTGLTAHAAFSDDKPKMDTELAAAGQGLSAYMFREEVTVKLVGDGRSRDLVITSARDAELRETLIYVRSGTMRVFRADAEKDDFTKSGGIYWRFFGKEGTVKFKTPGALVMVVRNHDDTVKFYTLAPDIRC